MDNMDTGFELQTNSVCGGIWKSCVWCLCRVSHTWCLISRASMYDGPAREWNIPGKADGCVMLDIRRCHALIRGEIHPKGWRGRKMGKGREGAGHFMVAHAIVRYRFSYPPSHLFYLIYLHAAELPRFYTDQAKLRHQSTKCSWCGAWQSNWEEKSALDRCFLSRGNHEH